MVEYSCVGGVVLSQVVAVEYSCVESSLIEL